MMRISLKQRSNLTSSRYNLLALILIITVHSIASADSASDEKKLAKLQRKINQLQLELEQDNKKKDKATYELKLAEQAISHSSIRLRRLDNKLSTAKTNLKKLNREQLELEKQTETNRFYLVKQIQASYAMGKQEYIKLLLNQQNPSRVARMVVYYQYFNESRVARLQEIDTSLSRLNEVSRGISENTEQLSQLRQQIIDDQKVLNTTRRQRQELVAQLSAKLSKKDQALQALLQDEQHLKRLLDQIESELGDVEKDLAAPKDFAQLQGQLPWPANGKLTARFGSMRNSAGNLKWKGIVIQTQAGENIRSVAYGRVVFADWLRGFGMLLIIDHGKGYMSLYGHNEQLHKKLGDWVQANEVIATSGNSGGQDTTSLYFEIRHNGVPQNPKKWCRLQPDLS